MTAVARVCAVALFAMTLSATASAQESKSTSLAKQLAAALDAAKLDSVATQDPSASDTFIGALYFPGLELLVVSAKYTVPALLIEKLSKKEYRDVYIDLNSASVPESKVFIDDLGADGLKAERNENQPFDTFEEGAKRVAFDSDWKKQKLTKEDYMKTFASSDERYSRFLTALLAQLKKTS